MTLPRRFLPSIASLRALETLDRLGSATATAQALSLTQSAVSRQLQTLESQLGTALILREGRRMTLTPQAVRYAAEIRTALEQIARASLRLTVNPDGGTLNLAILPTFGMRRLVPRLPDFVRAHPEVTINLATRLKPFSFADEPFDAAIHFGNLDWPDTEALLLRPESVLPVCAPALLEGRMPSCARDLLSLPLMHIATRPEAWRAWFAAHDVGVPRVTGTIHDQFSTLTQAALHGLGVALLPHYLAEQDIATGRLVAAWGGPTDSPGAYYLVWPLARREDAALRSFRDWLAGQTEEADPLPR